MRHAFLVLSFALLSVCIGIGSARADDRRVFDLSVGGGVGGPVILISGDPLLPPTTAMLTGIAYARLQAPKYTPCGLEASFLPGYGAGVNLTFTMLHIGRFYWHAVDPGLFWDIWHPVSVAVVPRTWDLTLGTGLDFRVWRRLSLTADWRVFLPSPFQVITSYGDFSRLIYREAFQGGQAWFGASWSF